MTENEKGSFRKVIGDGDTLHFVGLSDEEEAKLRALHDVETIRILRVCMEDAQFLSANPEQTFPESQIILRGNKYGDGLPHLFHIHFLAGKNPFNIKWS